jgi:predicted HNH restriction endonuclease
MPKNLVVCPNCESHGTKTVLGEIDKDGYFAVLRFHNGYTRITGHDFAVVCGNCGETIYIRKEAHGTDSYIRESRISRLSFVGTII